jgi:hypothetical protein
MSESRCDLVLSVQQCDNGFIVYASCGIPTISDSVGFKFEKIAVDRDAVTKLLEEAISEYEQAKTLVKEQKI